jgi:hypothetical protein
VRFVNVWLMVRAKLVDDPESVAVPVLTPPPGWWTVYRIVAGVRVTVIRTVIVSRTARQLPV